MPHTWEHQGLVVCGSEAPAAKSASPSTFPYFPRPSLRPHGRGHCGLCGEESDCPWFTWTPPDPALGTCGQSLFSPRLHPGPLSLDLRHDLGASVPLSAVGAGVGTYLTDQTADHSLLDLVTVPP